MGLPEHIEAPFQRCTLVLTRAEYLDAVKRGKAFRRARERRKRIEGARTPAGVEGHILDGLSPALPDFGPLWTPSGHQKKSVHCEAQRSGRALDLRSGVQHW